MPNTKPQTFSSIKILSFLRQHSLSIGASLWVLSIQYYISQLIVATAWHRANIYSWRFNTISDLANTHCGIYGQMLVCSPLHLLMNASFLLLGLTMAGGAYLLRGRLAHDAWTRRGLDMLLLAALGTILVGLFPENTIGGLHILGAALPFLFGNLAMVVLGLKLTALPPTLRLFSLVSGAVGLIALMLFLAGAYLGLGIGGMERLVSYPQSIWMIVVGTYILLNRSKYGRVA